MKNSYYGEFGGQYVACLLYTSCAIPLSYQEEKGESIGIDGIIGTGAYMLEEYREGAVSYTHLDVDS